MAAKMAAHFLQALSVSLPKRSGAEKQIKWPSLRNGGHFFYCLKSGASIELANENSVLRA